MEVFSVSKTRSGLSVWIAAAVAALTLGVPTAAYAGVAGGLLDDVTHTVDQATQTDGGGTGSGDAENQAPAPESDAPPTYVPPAPSAEGTVAAVDVTAGDATVSPADEAGGGEDIVVGRSRGEQNDDDYHGHV